ncbi:MAG: hypothetical protein AAF512_05170 [Pseudomonadota bacterium]
MNKPVWALLIGVLIGAFLMFIGVSTNSERAEEVAEVRETMNSFKMYQHYADMVKNSNAMAMLALDGLIDTQIDEGHDVVVEHLLSLIERSPNPSLRNAMRFRLAEIYFDRDEPEPAIELLEQIILSAGMDSQSLIQNLSGMSHVDEKEEEEENGKESK